LADGGLPLSGATDPKVIPFPGLIAVDQGQAECFIGPQQVVLSELE
jgi:hypothetical protein